MRQFRTSGSVRGAAREGGPYRETISDSNPSPAASSRPLGFILPIPFFETTDIRAARMVGAFVVELNADVTREQVAVGSALKNPMNLALRITKR